MMMMMMVDWLVDVVALEWNGIEIVAAFYPHFVFRLLSIRVISCPFLRPCLVVTHRPLPRLVL